MRKIHGFSKVEQVYCCLKTNFSALIDREEFPTFTQVHLRVLSIHNALWLPIAIPLYRGIFFVKQSKLLFDFLIVYNFGHDDSA